MLDRFAAILLAHNLGAMVRRPLTEYSQPPTRFMRRHKRKYQQPHQGAQEIARRKSQIERGIIKVSK